MLEQEVSAYVPRQTRKWHSGGRRFDPDQLHKSFDNPGVAVTTSRKLPVGPLPGRRRFKPPLTWGEGHSNECPDFSVVCVESRAALDETERHRACDTGV